MHILNEKRKKLDPESEKCILVGYSLEQKGYKCFNPSTRKLCVSRDVVFEESASWYEAKPTPPKPFPVNPNLPNQEIEVEDQLKHIFEESSITTMLSWLPSDKSTSLPSPKMDKGKAKMPVSGLFASACDTEAGPRGS